MKARRVDDILRFADAGMGQPGDFEISNGTDGQPAAMLIFCPGPCRTVAALALKDGLGPKDKWQWDGNVESPTLTPSIDHVGCWHGWLRNGEFTPA